MCIYNAYILISLSLPLSLSPSIYTYMYIYVYIHTHTIICQLLPHFCGRILKSWILNLKTVHRMLLVTVGAELWDRLSEIVPGYRQPSPLQRASKEGALLHEIPIIGSIFEWLLRNPICWNFEVNARLHSTWSGGLFCLQIASLDPNPSSEYKTEPRGTTVCFKVINLHKELITCILKCLYLRYGNAWNITSHRKASKFFNLDPLF